MTTVDDVAGEVGLPATAVLDACGRLDIVASSGASGLSADEHRRLRAALDARPGLAPVVGGSTDPAPGAGSPPPDRPEPGRPRRLSPRTLTRIGLYTFLLVAVVVAVVTLRDRAGDPATTAVQAFTDADEGTCVDLGTGSPRLTPVDCQGPHDAELYEVADLALGDAFPGSEVVVAEAERMCAEPFARHVGRPYGESALAVVFLVPTRRTWAAGDRTVLCLVEDPAAPLVGIVAGADR